MQTHDARTARAARSSPEPDPMVPGLATVTATRREAPDVVTIEVTAPGWTGFHPGQFNMLTAFGIGEVPISLSGPSSSPDRIVHTIRAVGAASGALARLDKGAVLGLRGPYGRPWPLAAARGRDVLVVAGGLGLAPVRPLLYALAEDRAAFGRVSLLYGAQSPDSVLFGDELDSWRAAGIEVEVTVDRPAPGWTGHVGLCTSLLDHAQFDPDRSTAFVCGPEPMMRATAEGLTHLGLAARDVHVSLERNMQCGIGLCGHCQLGPLFVCKDGPVFDWATIGGLMRIREL